MGGLDIGGLYMECPFMSYLYMYGLYMGYIVYLLLMGDL